MRPEHADELDGVEFDALRAALDDLDTADVEMHTPPPSIWNAIDASVASEAARIAPARSATGGLIEYTIDEHDVVVAVGGEWAEFATDNGAADLVAPPTDRTLWSYFDQPEVAELWQMIVSHVRSHGAVSQLPFRCDAPQARRWFEMSVDRVPGGGVRFRSQLVFEEERAPVALLDAAAERDPDAEPVVVCAWCNRGNDEDQWIEIDKLLRARRMLERAAPPSVTWSICGACRDDMAVELLVADASA